jgi:ATP-dependent Clp protease adaptor protein ClpS
MSDEAAQSPDTPTPAAATPVKEPRQQHPKPLPPWKVLLHNDDVNTVEYVTETILTLTPLKRPDAIERTIEAHKRGVSLLLTTHQERAELYHDQFTSKGLTVTIERGE